MLLGLGSLGLAGCVSYSMPYYADDGVYYDDRQYRPARTHVRTVDPRVYPYWSIDYFYFSHHYRPYSVVANYYDPWLHSGLWYAYRPWYGYGGYYASYRPWHSSLWLSYRYSNFHHRRDYHHQTGPRTTSVDPRFRNMERRTASDRPIRTNRQAPTRIPDRIRRGQPKRPPAMRAPRTQREMQDRVIEQRKAADVLRAAVPSVRRSDSRSDPPARIERSRDQSRSSSRPERSRSAPPRSHDRQRPSRSRQSGSSRRDRHSGDRRDH